MFPHKTLSQIEELTEALTTMRTSGQRTGSGASGSRGASERMSTTTDSGAVHLGLPVSLRCQQGSTGNDDEEEDARKDSKVATASSSADPKEGAPSRRQMRSWKQSLEDDCNLSRLEVG